MAESLTADAEHWVREYEKGAEYIEHLDGVPWHEAKVPGRWHKCKAQTRGWLLGKSALTTGYVERCACGATRLGHDRYWIEKNQTRKGRRRRK